MTIKGRENESTVWIAEVSLGTATTWLHHALARRREETLDGESKWPQRFNFAKHRNRKVLG